ncbi:MAG: ABC transporter ATP-binding protein, partial [Phycisphaerales bacterium]
MSRGYAMERGMVVVDDVHKWFGSVHAVRGVSFELPAGTVAGLLGHNGAGKSTTIRMIAGYITPDAGRVSIAGHDMTEQRLQATRQMGYLPESTPLYPEMPTKDYLEFRGRLFGLSRETRRKRVDEVIERCWLKDVRLRCVGQLSKGYRQRVGLAASLLHEPR